jgi:hypothetical protein
MGFLVVSAYGCGLVGGFLFLLLLRPRTGSLGQGNLTLLIAAAVVWHWACVVLPAALIVFELSTTMPASTRSASTGSHGDAATPIALSSCLTLFSALALWYATTQPPCHQTTHLVALFCHFLLLGISVYSSDPIVCRSARAGLGWGGGTWCAWPNWR